MEAFSPKKKKILPKAEDIVQGIELDAVTFARLLPGPGKFVVVNLFGNCEFSL